MAPAFMEFSVKKALRILAQAACLLVFSAGLVAVLVASFAIIGFSIVWYHEGLSQPSDRMMLAKAVIWLIGSSVVVALVWWLRCLSLVDKVKDQSFKLVESKSGRPEKLVQGATEIGFFALVLVHVWAVDQGTPVIQILHVAGWLSVAFVATHLRILLHELGHLTAAWLLGSDLRKIQVGIGPLLWSRSLENGLRCEWRLRPLGGYLLATHRGSEAFRIRQSVVVAGGPIADFILLFVSYRLITRAFGGLDTAFAGSRIGLFAVAFFWWTAFSAIGGLVPLRIWMGDRRMWTDGYWLLRLWTASRERIAEFAVSHDWRRGLEMLENDIRKKRTDVLPAELPECAARRNEDVPNFQQLQARLASRLCNVSSSAVSLEPNALSSRSSMAPPG